MDDFTAVWTAVLNNRIVVNSENARLWSLPDGVEWIGGIKELYNRPCYDYFTGQISSLSRVLVIGTPGFVGITITKPESFETGFVTLAISLGDTSKKTPSE